MQTQGDGLTVLVKETVDGLGHLVAEHVRLSKLELLENMTAMARQTGRLAVVTGFAFVGYVFACAGIVASIEPRLGLAYAAFVVGGLNFVVGAAGLFLTVTKLAGTRILDGTATEVHRTVSDLAAATHGEPVNDR